MSTGAGRDGVLSDSQDRSIKDAVYKGSEGVKGPVGLKMIYSKSRLEPAFIRCDTRGMARPVASKEEGSLIMVQSRRNSFHPFGLFGVRCPRNSVLV